MTETSFPDQTIKQPVVWFCLNDECQNPLQPGFFEFESDYPKCPKCTAEGEPIVHKRSLIHFLQPDVKGPIRGQRMRFKMACDPKRDELATLTNGEAASGAIEAVNCPGCLKALGHDLVLNNFTRRT